MERQGDRTRSNSIRRWAPEGKVDIGVGWAVCAVGERDRRGKGGVWVPG